MDALQPCVGMPVHGIIRHSYCLSKLYSYGLYMGMPAHVSSQLRVSFIPSATEKKRMNVRSMSNRRRSRKTSQNLRRCLDSYGLYSYGLYSYGLYSYGLHSYGLHSYGVYSYGLYSYGQYSYGLDGYGQ